MQIQSDANGLFESLRRCAHSVAPKRQTGSGVESFVIGYDRARKPRSLFLYYYLGLRNDGARWISHGAADAPNCTRLGMHSNERADGPHKQHRREDSCESAPTLFCLHDAKPRPS